MFPRDFDAGMLLTGGEGVVDVQSWPREGVVLGVALLMGTAASLQHSLGIFILSQEWQLLLGMP